MFLTSHLSRAAALPGAYFLLKNHWFFKHATCRGSCAAWGRTFSQQSDVFFLNKALAQGSCAAWGRTVSQKPDFFEEATCPGQLRCLGQNLFQKSDIFFEQATCPGQLRCLGQRFFLKKHTFLKKNPLVRGSYAAWGRTFSQNILLVKKSLV